MQKMSQTADYLKFLNILAKSYLSDKGMKNSIVLLQNMQVIENQIKH